MRALSIKQPWLYCITDSTKRIENRAWKPPATIIGERIALHSSKAFDKRFAYSACDLSGLNLFYIEMPLGSIVATAVVRGWVDDTGFCSHTQFRHYVNNPWFFGPIGWVLGDILKLPKPIPYRGMLGLWNVPDGVM